MTALVLDRIELDDVGANPRRLADAIHRQLGDPPKPVPVHDIARALDIIEIREEPLENLEAALIAPPGRGFGLILINRNSSWQRRRYSVGHELLHFLNPWHEQTSEVGFECSSRDMIERNDRSNDPHRRQEAEANAFAIELLAPDALTKPFIDGPSNLASVVAMANELDISREAATRRYIEKHEECLAALFVANGLLRYAVRGEGFPRLVIGEGQRVMPLASFERARLSQMEEVDAEDWLREPNDIQLSLQVLNQQNGFATILLRREARGEDDSELEDAFERFERFDSRRDR